MPGLLDTPGFDPAEFQVSDEERKRLLLGNILLGISAGAFNSNKGNQIGALGSGMLLGVQNGQRALSDAQAAKLDKLKAASGYMDFAGKKQAYLDDQAGREVMQNFRPPSPSLADPTPANAAALAAQPKPGMYEQLNALADAFQAKGLGKKAEEYRIAAEKYKPEFDTTPRYGTDANGQRIAYILDKQGNQRMLPTGPDMEKAHFADSGGAILPLDPFTGQPRSQGIGKSMTPGEVASNELGQKNYGLSAAHLKLAQDKANQEKGEQYGTPIQITTPEGGTSLMIPRKGTNQLVPMVDGAGNAVTKSASIPQKYKDTLYSLNNLEGALGDYQSALKAMKPADFFKAAKLTDLEAKFGATQMGLKNLFELGAIAGPDMAILEQNLTNPASMKGASLKAWGGLEAQNKVIKDILSRAKKNLAGAYNQRPQEYSPTGAAARMSDDELRKALGF